VGLGGAAAELREEQELELSRRRGGDGTFAYGSSKKIYDFLSA